MRIRIKTRVVLGYLFGLSCVSVFFGIYFLSAPHLPASKSRNGIERAARDSWSEGRRLERNSPLHFRRELYKLGIFSLWNKNASERKEPTEKPNQLPEKQMPKAGVAPPSQVLVPPRAVLAQMSWEDLSNLYHRYTQQVQMHCGSLERLGKVTDGGWEVCEDEPYRPASPCLVYSFGVGDDFSFDDAVAKRYGCEVHSFDPSMQSQDHQRPSSVHFHALGLANVTGQAANGWKMSTLADIQRSLGHTQRELTILKLDIEEWEWKVLPSLLASGGLSSVRQLLMELHQCDGCATYDPDQRDKEPPRDRYLLALGLLSDLHDLGFRIFHQHQNKACSYLSRFGWVKRNACCELHMVRL